jgi:hypothetical protein
VVNADRPAGPRCWPGSTIVCVASGPSLTAADVAFCQGRARVLVINDGYRLAPWADVLYAADSRWWLCHQDTKQFAGLKYSVQPCMDRSDITVLRQTGRLGLESDPTGLRTGGHSGYQAIGLAVHLGAARILLLGYDLRLTKDRVHWFGSHPSPLNDPREAQFLQWRTHYATLVDPLQARGVEVINCTPESALWTFPRMTLAEAFASVAVLL